MVPAVVAVEGLGGHVRLKGVAGVGERRQREGRGGGAGGGRLGRAGQQRGHGDGRRGVGPLLPRGIRTSGAAAAGRGFAPRRRCRGRFRAG